MPHKNVLCSWRGISSLTGASREPRKPAPPRNRPDGRLESARASEDSSELGLCRSRSLHPSGVSAARRDTKVSRRYTKYLSHPGAREMLASNGLFLASSSFVTFRATFVSRGFGITRGVGTWRRRRVKRSFEPGDDSALPIAEGDLPKPRVFVVRAERREA